ncbi:AAA family ATPase [Kribbella alba]|uniref:AAA family ATPase n=1 Tax=Kribbella alba TaxID=190197 RepID=A0ABN2F734_9ACTN
MELVIIFGPAAVGKMTVGHEVCKLTGFKLFHNHVLIEPVLDIFPFGSPQFERVVGEFRRRIITEAADAAIPGLVFTYVWGLDIPEDTDVVASYIDLVESRGGRARLVELAADQRERIARNGTDFRLDQKRSKRDLEWSHRNLVELDSNFVLNTGGGRRTKAEDLIDKHDYLRIDNTQVAAPAAARMIVSSFGLEVVGM